jgi:tRNA pseudouridine38-40 synthase
MPRFALALEYDGTNYCGWQTQVDAPSVQSALEAALSTVADHPVEVVTAGRTDTGVHATSQVVHFDAAVDRGERGWLLGANTRLPDDIGTLWIKRVPDDFHARFSATARSYRYLILNRASRPALERNRACWMRKPLDHERMHSAAQSLIGTHDFSSYRAAECQSKTPIRRMEKIAVTRQGDYVVIQVTANAFLHHMVRNIAGVLLAIGKGDRPVEWAQTVLDARDRRSGGVTAPPQGLYLIGVRYPESYGLASEPEAGGGLPAEPGPRINAPGVFPL